MEAPIKAAAKICQQCLRMPAVRQVATGRRKVWKCQPCLDRARPHGYNMVFKKT
jgi:ribosomal protein L37AE/L43A